ncbi:MAG: MarR family transcriptional regulator [Fusobacteriaceae bacterium]|nr:MarR family transcriptional regulator [Fusobacteriaceae bacterium]MBN2838757.1 MarR family transcriptional regulator [Fusobacteriaceae bacterium]
MKRDNNINLKLFVVLNKCSITVGRKSEKTIRPTGLTIPQFSVLEILYNKGDLKVGDIIEKSLSTVGNISLVIDNLCKLGYTEKKKCTLDKRITYVTLTEKGRKLMDNMWTPHVEEMDNIMSVLDLEEKETLISLLKKLGKS